jgi:hypothetical protein
MMHTPSGRFQVNMRLCLSMSDYHPETWQPSWSVATVLQGLLSFMTGTDITTGSVETSDDEKRRCAQESMAVNLRNPVFCKMFPEAPEWARAKSLGLARPSKGGINLAVDNEDEHQDEKEEGGGAGGRRGAGRVLCQGL